MKKWVASFKRGKYSIKDEDRLGRLVSVPTLVNTDALHDIILSDRQIGLQRISEVLNISYKRVYHKVNVHLNMRNISTKWFQKDLNFDQKRARIEAWPLIFAWFAKEADFLSVATMDEFWVHLYDAETKQQSM